MADPTTDPDDGQPTIRLYTDESGNTGTKLFATDQPIFVFAMLQMTDEQKRSIQEDTSGARQKWNGEMKLKDLKRNPQGIEILETIVNAMGRVGVSFHYAIVEKLYFACRYVTETFLDPRYNKYAPIKLPEMGAMRWETNRIYDTCEAALLEKFTNAIYDSHNEGIQTCGRAIAARLRLHFDDQVAAMGHVLERGIETAFDWKAAITEKPPGMRRQLKLPNPTIAAFAPLLSGIQRRLELHQMTAELLSDNDKQFGPLLDETLRLCKLDEGFPGGVSEYGVEGPFMHIIKRTEFDSKNEFGIQLADITAGLIRYIATTHWDDQPPQELSGAWESLRSLGDIFYWETSEAMLRKLQPIFGDIAPGLDPI